MLSAAEEKAWVQFSSGKAPVVLGSLIVARV